MAGSVAGYRSPSSPKLGRGAGLPHFGKEQFHISLDLRNMVLFPIPGKLFAPFFLSNNWHRLSSEDKRSIRKSKTRSSRRVSVLATARSSCIRKRRRRNLSASVPPSENRRSDM